jgi:translation initiation factor eIF-2B subunit epsilon
MAEDEHTQSGPFDGGSVITAQSDGEGLDESYNEEASSLIYEALKSGIKDLEAVKLELLSGRLGSNATDHQVRKAIVEGFMRCIQHLMKEKSLHAATAVKEAFNSASGVVDLMGVALFDKNKTKKDDQVDFLLLLQRDLSTRENTVGVLEATCVQLYDINVLEEEAYEQWWGDPRSDDGEGMKKVKAKVQQFMDWLANASEESSGDDADEDSD